MNTPDESKDLLIDMSENTLELLKTGVVSPELFNVRDEINKLDIEKADEYSDNLLYQAYYAAKKRKTTSASIIAHDLKISRQLYDYYLKKYPKLAVIVNMGLMDAKEDMKHTIVDALFDAAKGQTVVETSEAVETTYDTEGAVVGTKQKIVTVQKKVPPNVQAALELMRKLDPSWTPNVKIDINHTENKTLHVIEDLNVAVDYRKLSADALKQLIESSRVSHDDELQKLESGESITNFNNDVLVEIPNEIVEEPPKVIRKPRKSKMPEVENGYRTRKKKTRLMLENHNSYVNNVRKQAKKEADKNLKGE